MPTLRLVYLTEQQYAGMMDNAHVAANNNTTAEAQLPYIYQQEQTTRLVPIAGDATRNALSYAAVGEEMKMEEQSDHEEDNNGCLDTLLQEASIDAVNSRSSVGGHAVRHQQVQQDEMILSSSDTESENDSSASSERVRVADAVQQFQHEMESSETEREDDSTAQEDAVQQKSGNKRKRPAKIRVQRQTFDERFNKLMAFKAKYGHCNVSQHGEDPSLGSWCNGMRSSYRKIQNNQMPNIKLSDEQIQRLNDAGFTWSLRETFEERFNDLMSFKAKHGHCNVSQHGDDSSLGSWVSTVRVSYKRIQNNQMSTTKLSGEQIQRLDDAGFKWSLKDKFEKRFNDLMYFKVKNGHCDVPGTGENVPLGKWCSTVRVSYKKIQNNQMPSMKLSDEQIQRLNDAGFNNNNAKVNSYTIKKLNQKIKV
jgi:hypothetical protein